MGGTFGRCDDDGRRCGPPESLVEIRDRMVDCFAATHGPHFGRTRTALGLQADHAAIRRSVEDMVRLAFRQCGGSFDQPTPHALVRVVTFLAERSLEWGVHPDAVFEHHVEMTRLVGVVEVSFRGAPMEDAAPC